VIAGDVPLESMDVVDTLTSLPLSVIVWDGLMSWQERVMDSCDSTVGFPVEVIAALFDLSVVVGVST
jgi:hypothetical protein